MNTFAGVAFNGTFRDYQQNVLNNAQNHIKDGKIHIVAAPGSGKTILGLELIRRIQRPALILSPSVTIRQQWGERFCDNFLGGKATDGYISYDLKNPSLLTSVTYQALHSAYTKTTIPKEKSDSDEETESELQEDFSDFDLIKQIKACGIGTICLDEAHHLRSEWQKSLEGFISAVSDSVYVISLTATPPYDSTPNEWKRYISLCGEIDEEIFVPQLVAQKTLCPHQDYIYFNYPTQEEEDALNEHKARAVKCVNEILSGDIFNKILFAPVFSNYRDNEECILENAKGFIAILCLARYKGVKIPTDLITLVSPDGKLPDYDTTFAERAFQFVIDSPKIFGDELSDQLRKKLSQSGLTEKKAVTLNSNEKIDKMLVSSLGKLKSIEQIVLSETQNLGSNLRMLILTDFIKKDMMGILGTQESITAMGTVPIFEILRRCVGDRTNIGLLSGGLVILPNAVLNNAAAIAAAKNITFSSKPIGNTVYSEVTFGGSNKNKVTVMTEVFQQGLINILVGTKSLLGEGWDSPCINSLILASFVGSFMLSNQMRGRAIRMDKTNPYKASNIWHLVTVEPDISSNGNGSQNTIHGNDFATMERRFAGFLAPAYSRNVIESGIQRLDIIKPPYSREGIERINSQMLSMSADRATMTNRWNCALGDSKRTEVLDINEVPASVQPQGYSFKNKLSLVFLIIAIIALLLSIIGFVTLGTLPLKAVSILVLVVALITGIISIVGIVKSRHFVSPKNTVKTLGNAILHTLIYTGEIRSSKALICVSSEKAGTNVVCTLRNATAHEKEVFKKAMEEMLSPIDNPRYLMIKVKGGKKMYYQSYACPAIIGAKKESAQLLASHLSLSMGRVDIVYTRTRSGRADLLNCRKYSYINVNKVYISGKKAAISEWS